MRERTIDIDELMFFLRLPAADVPDFFAVGGDALFIANVVTL
jgi:hypothetical protein